MFRTILIATLLALVGNPALASQIKWVYNPAGAPSQFSQSDVASAIQNAISAWSACGVPMVFAGITNAPMRQADGYTVVGWDSGFSEMGRTTQAFYQGRIDRDVLLNPRRVNSLAGLNHVVMHEAGHVQGVLDHSPMSDSVMQARPRLRPGETGVMTPSPQDIRNCKQVNGSY